MAECREINFGTAVTDGGVSLRPMYRPGFGTAGMTVSVKTNYCSVNVPESTELYKYDVLINPEEFSEKVRRDIIEELCLAIKPSLVYDGKKTVYSACQLDFESRKFYVLLKQSKKKFQVKISNKHSANIPLLLKSLKVRGVQFIQSHLDYIAEVLHEIPSKSPRYASVGRTFFSFEDRKSIGCMAFAKGFRHILCPTQDGLALKMDMVTKPFLEEVLVSEFVYQNFHLASGAFSAKFWNEVGDILKGIDVLVDDPLTPYTICGLSSVPVEEVRTTSAHHLIQNPSLPAVQFGTEGNPIYFPMEACKILEGQRYYKNLEANQLKKIIDFSTEDPLCKQKRITETLNSINYKENLYPEFDIQVVPNLRTIKARILKGPLLNCQKLGKKFSFTPKYGQWEIDDEKEMYEGVEVKKWTCVNFSHKELGAFDKSLEDLIRTCRRRGVVFKSRILPFIHGDPRNIEKTLDDIYKRAKRKEINLEILIVILPDHDQSAHGKIKKHCDIKLGIMTQCCRPTKLLKRPKCYFDYLAMKINSKVGGKNFVLAIENNPAFFISEQHTIIFGADVIHSVKNGGSKCSIAAVVASMDWPLVSKYRGEISAQRDREEIIQDLYKVTEDSKGDKIASGMIRALLLAFYQSNGKQKPRRIIFYRDGVGNKQFKDVLKEEVKQIRQACLSFEDSYRPYITFVVVQKHNTTRLFPSSTSDVNRKGNLLAGTIVDSGICHPHEYDYYLISHAGVQGTSRPTHYYVLLDENKFTADTLQTLTYNLCFTYVRCPSSLSIVPPVQYAHLLAFRARDYVNTDMDEGTNMNVEPLPAINKMLKNLMFYC